MIASAPDSSSHPSPHLSPCACHPSSQPSRTCTRSRIASTPLPKCLITTHCPCTRTFSSADRTACTLSATDSCATMALIADQAAVAPSATYTTITASLLLMECAPLQASPTDPWATLSMSTVSNLTSRQLSLRSSSSCLEKVLRLVPRNLRRRRMIASGNGARTTFGTLLLAWYFSVAAVAASSNAAAARATLITRTTVNTMAFQVATESLTCFASSKRL